MIDYQTYCQIRQLHIEKKLGFRQIARELKLDLKTVRKWARREKFQKAPLPKCRGRQGLPSKRAVEKRIRFFAGSGAMKKAGDFSAGLLCYGT
jgi:hypothetical protein